MPSTRRARLIVFTVAAATFLLHLATNGRYGFFRDELYFLACGRHLAWGYVDQPPLIAVVARLFAPHGGEPERWLVWFRLPAALAHAATVLLAGVAARRLGGGAWAALLATLATALAPGLVGGGHLMTMNAFEPLVWTALLVVVLAIVDGASPRWWVAAGALVGIGFLFKHSMLFCAVPLLAALALTSARPVLRSRWLAVGMAVAAALALPHVVWQVRAGWPMLELLRNGQLYKNEPLSPAALAAGQVLLLGPPGALVALAGWIGLARDPRRRAFAVWYVLFALVMTALHAKVYYLAPAYPFLLAAGGVALERWAPRLGRGAAALRVGTAALVVGVGLAMLPLTLPLLSPPRLVAYMQRLGISPPHMERKVYRALPQWFADEHGWRALADTVARVWRTLPSAERAHAAIMTSNYGEAGALDLYGPALGLPPARSGHNNYWLWGPGPPSEVIVTVGLEPKGCGERVLAARTPANPYVMAYEDRLPIWICRHPDPPLAARWADEKNYN